MRSDESGCLWARLGLHLDAATRTKAVRPGETPVKSASRVSMRVETADRTSKRYISHACSVLRRRFNVIDEFDRIPEHNSAAHQ